MLGRLPGGGSTGQRSESELELPCWRRGRRKRGNGERASVREGGKEGREGEAAVWASAGGGRGYDTHLGDQGERAKVKADLPSPAPAQITRSSLCTPAKFQGLPLPTHLAPQVRDGLFHLQDPEPCPWRAEHRGCALKTLPYETEGPGEREVENWPAGGWSHGTKARRPSPGFCSIRR